MPQIDVIANENARYKRNDLECCFYAPLYYYYILYGMTW